MAKIVKMCDMTPNIAATVTQMLNGGSSKLEIRWTNGVGVFGLNIVTDIEPKDLTYPEGWYYAKGSLRNKHTSTTGMYSEIPMEKFDGTPWGDIATYCTRSFD